MLIYNFLFYFFAITLVMSAFGVVRSKNPVYGILWLILAFFNAAGLFLLLGAEFIAMVTIIVYVGAVLVLFLFVIMTINIDITSIKKEKSKLLGLGIFISLILFLDLCIVFGKSINQSNILIAEPLIKINKISDISNTHAIGVVLYTEYAYPFIISGLVLFLAMIGSISLSMIKKSESKKQNISEQVSRSRDDSIEIVRAQFHKGIKNDN